LTDGRGVGAPSLGGLFDRSVLHTRLRQRVASSFAVGF
jgi:hypothetical protein